MNSKTVKDLVPGDPEEIWLLADSYNRMARTCEEIGHGFRTIDDGGWFGRAAEAFHAQVDQQPKRFLAMADSYGQAAVALDTYASVLAWAQRQAGEVIALGDKEDPPPDPPERVRPTPAEQAELTGVIAGTDEPEPDRIDRQALAQCTYRRALAMLDTVGNESAATITNAAELMPAPFPVTPARPSVGPTPVAGLAMRTVLGRQEPPPLLDSQALRADLHNWAAAIKEIRKKLRWDGLDRLSPRLAQHLFHGHYRPGRQEDTGYHHREGGIDRGALRVVEIIDGPDPHGVYVARVSGPHTTPHRMKASTFFPDSWSRATVLHAVRHAFLTGDYDPATRRFRGEYQGVQIVGHIKRGPAEPRLCDIVTAYPRGVRKRRKRS